MKIITTVTTLVLGATLALGCDTPSKAQKEADQARQQANESADKAQREADQAKLLAQSNAEHKQQEAALTLASAKSDYKARLTKLLADIDNKVADLRADSANTNAKTKANNDLRITNLMAKRDVITRDTTLIDNATADTWDNVKKQVDTDVSDAKNAFSSNPGKT
jgi:hypothetical protein